MVEAGKVAGEVRNPRRTLPLAFTLGVLIVTAVYLLVSFAFLSVVPVERIVSNTAFVAQFGEALFGCVGGKVLSACVLLSVLGGLMALTMAAPRVYYAMAKDGAFFAAFGRLHSRFGTPANAVLLQTGLALPVLCFGAFDRILSFIIFSAICFLALSAASLFRLKEPVMRWWYPAAPILFLVGCTLINLLILVHDPVPALLGLLAVLCGDPFGVSSSLHLRSLCQMSPNNPLSERSHQLMPHIQLPEGYRASEARWPTVLRPPSLLMIWLRYCFTDLIP
jgi:basic amino acid/polyamine antiporter, APA family